MKLESQTDIDNENRICDFCNRVLQVELKKLPPNLYNIDRVALKNNNIEFWAEVKCRNTLSTKKDAFYEISLFKMMEGRALEQATGLPFYLIVEFREGIFSLKPTSVYSDNAFRVIWGGREPRPGAVSDKEPMAYFETDCFHPVDLENYWAAE